MCGCVTAMGTRMGTSVCLHSDELVSELPLERAWLSPMTHSLLYLQDHTLPPAQPVATALALAPEVGLWLAALFLASPLHLPSCYHSGHFPDLGKSSQVTASLHQLLVDCGGQTSQALRPPGSQGLEATQASGLPARALPLPSTCHHSCHRPFPSSNPHPPFPGQAPLRGPQAVLKSLVPTPSLSCLLSTLGSPSLPGPLPSPPACCPQASP